MGFPTPTDFSRLAAAGAGKVSPVMEARMLTRALLLFLTALAVAPDLGLAQSTSPNGVRTLDPPGAIKAEGTWSLGVRAGDFVFVAGMQASTSHQRIGQGSAGPNLTRLPQSQADR